MAFPRRLLVDGEELVLDLRPHWIALVGPIVVAVLGIAAFIVLWVYAPRSGAGRSAVLWGGLIALFVLLVWYPTRRAVRWATSHFVVTSDRVIHRQGWIAKSSMEIPLEAINDVRFSQGILERMIGAGDLTIESAGERGTNVFSDIRHPEEVQKTIYHQGELNQQRMMRGGVAPAAPSAPSTAGELERLASLRDRGVLTPEEFEAQKRKVLGS